MSHPGTVISQPSPQVQMEMTPQIAPPMQGPGLDYLAHLDQLVVRQKVELWEAISGMETRNKYRVLNKLDQELFFVSEESDPCIRQCCGPNRGFIFHVQSMTPDGPKQEVMRLDRPFLCCKGDPCCADGCCMYPIYVIDGAGRQMGIVRATNSCCSPRFGVFDPSEKQIFAIRGKCCQCQGVCCPEDIELSIFNAGETTEVAKIAKQWGGFARELITDADNLSITFPMSMTIEHKSLLLASVLMIDMLMFEKK